MEISEFKNLVHKFNLVINKEKYFFGLRKKIELNINKENKYYYTKEYTF